MAQLQLNLLRKKRNFLFQSSLCCKSQKISIVRRHKVEKYQRIKCKPYKNRPLPKNNTKHNFRLSLNKPKPGLTVLKKSVSKSTWFLIYFLADFQLPAWMPLKWELMKITKKSNVTVMTAKLRCLAKWLKKESEDQSQLIFMKFDFISTPHTQTHAPQHPNACPWSHTHSHNKTSTLTPIYSPTHSHGHTHTYVWLDFLLLT